MRNVSFHFVDNTLYFEILENLFHGTIFCGRSGVADWLVRWTSESGVPGSNPGPGRQISVGQAISIVLGKVVPVKARR